jgi:hypothetical protein
MSDVESRPRPEPPPDGILTLLPVALKEGCTLVSVINGLLPWGSPSVLGVVGTNPSGEALLVLAHEWPIPWARVTSPLAKRDVEVLQVERFRSDFTFGTQEAPFLRVVPGSDPPDFVVETAAGPIGLECTAFTTAERREAHALFAGIRRTLVSLPRQDVLHLAGNAVYMWFGGEGSLARPFRRNDKDAIAEIVDGLVAYKPSADRLRVPGGSMPAQAPDPGIVTTPTGASFYAVPFMGSVPGTLMYALQGFEVGLSYSTEHTKTTAWAEMQRLVSEHDKAGVDWLLISVGAPNQFGQTFPSDEAVARFAIENPAPLNAPTTIKRVSTHFWSTGEVWELFPKQIKLFGPIYQGLALAHQPLAVHQSTGPEPRA